MTGLRQTVSNDWFLSIILHILLILILLMISINLPKTVKELVVDWVTETEEIVPVNDELAPPVEQDADPAETQAIASSPIQHDSRDVTSTPQVDTKSNKILPLPLTTSENTRAEVVNPISDKPASGFLSKLKKKMAGSSGGGGSYEIEGADGQVKVLSKVLPNPTIGDYGKVTLQFKIKRDGTVSAESILPVQMDDARYTEAAINALKLWVFELQGNHNPNKLYKISFVFKPE